MVEIRATDQLLFTSIHIEDKVQAVVEIPVGSQVRWISDSDLPHTVTPVGHEEFPRAQAFQRGRLMLEHTFLNPGTFDYRCEFHSELGMRGRITVSP